MGIEKIIQLRLFNQYLSHKKANTAADVVTALGAMQAQDYNSSKWAIGVRMYEPSEENINLAITNRTIIRSWPMRGTLHFVPAEDLRWMLQLLTPKVISSMAGRLKQLEIDPPTLSKTRNILIKALRDGKQLSRELIFDLLERSSIHTINQRGIHLLQLLAMEGLICFGERENKKFTFTLLDEWYPSKNNLTPDESLAELARKYINGHGPATVHDLQWWSGLNLTLSQKALNLVKEEMEQLKLDDKVYWLSKKNNFAVNAINSVHLLPAFDEYLIGYRDRSAIISQPQLKNAISNNGIFYPILVIEGKIIGVWKTLVGKKNTTLTLKPFNKLSESELKLMSEPIEIYSKFKNTDIKIEIQE